MPALPPGGESFARKHPETDSSQQHLGGCLTRLCWMMLGNAALVFVGVAIAWKRAGIPSWADAVFWAIVVGLIVVRYLDISRFGGQTADGRETATMRHWRRYALLLVGASVILWGVAHGAAHLWPR